jgi:hypothetical protein
MLMNLQRRIFPVTKLLNLKHFQALGNASVMEGKSLSYGGRARYDTGKPATLQAGFAFRCSTTRPRIFCDGWSAERASSRVAGIFTGIILINKQEYDMILKRSIIRIIF